MSLGAVPDDGEVRIAGTGRSHAGRQLRAASGVPVVWVSDEAAGSGVIWSALADRSATSGLQPFLLSGMDVRAARPWDAGEQVSEPQDTAAIDTMDAAYELQWLWDTQAPSADELARDEDVREMFAPFGTGFPASRPPLERSRTRS